MKYKNIGYAKYIYWTWFGRRIGVGLYDKTWGWNPAALTNAPWFYFRRRLTHRYTWSVLIRVLRIDAQIELETLGSVFSD